jgi:hypothetical protein
MPTLPGRMLFGNGPEYGGGTFTMAEEQAEKSSPRSLRGIPFKLRVACRLFSRGGQHKRPHKGSPFIL